MRNGHHHRVQPRPVGHCGPRSPDAPVFSPTFACLSTRSSFQKWTETKRKRNEEFPAGSVASRRVIIAIIIGAVAEERLSSSVGNICVMWKSARPDSTRLMCSCAYCFREMVEICKGIWSVADLHVDGGSSRLGALSWKRTLLFFLIIIVFQHHEILITFWREKAFVAHFSFILWIRLLYNISIINDEIFVYSVNFPNSNDLYVMKGRFGTQSCIFI